MRSIEKQRQSRLKNNRNIRLKKIFDRKKKFWTIRIKKHRHTRFKIKTEIKNFYRYIDSKFFIFD